MKSYAGQEKNEAKGGVKEGIGVVNPEEFKEDLSGKQKVEDKYQIIDRELLYEIIQKIDEADTEKIALAISQTIGKLEDQLKSSVELNRLLREELDRLKLEYSNLSNDRDTLRERISKMESETPIKEELTLELEMAIEERDKSSIKIKTLNEQLKSANEKIRNLESSIQYIKRQRDDAYKEYEFAEKRLKSAVREIEDLRSRLEVTINENSSLKRKIKEYEDIIRKMRDEYEPLKKDVTEANEALDNIYRALLAIKQRVLGKE